VQAPRLFPCPIWRPVWRLDSWRAFPDAQGAPAARSSKLPSKPKPSQASMARFPWSPPEPPPVSESRHTAFVMTPKSWCKDLEWRPSARGGIASAGGDGFLPFQS
jgi:hypothetical protein